MTESVTLQLPNELALTAKTVARNTKRPLEDILVEWLDRAAAELPVESLNDEQVLALTQQEMDSRQQKQLSILLAKKRESALSDVERQQLHELMQLYRQGLVRKAEAFKVAVDHDLLLPLGE
ncbi:MAG: hypothetical protein HF973_18085 [Chloroflexi bacterium]|nr:hypothetical protein [Chloroflexota bacterium]